MSNNITMAIFKTQRLMAARTNTESSKEEDWFTNSTATITATTITASEATIILATIVDITSQAPTTC